MWWWARNGDGRDSHKAPRRSSYWWICARVPGNLKEGAKCNDVVQMFDSDRDGIFTEEEKDAALEPWQNDYRESELEELWKLVC